MGKSASKEFSREVLKTHNDYRKKHGASGLKLCSKLCKEAQQYAEALASTRVLKHSPESSRGQCGENLAWASYDQPGKEVSERWYSEIKSYNFNCPGFSSSTDFQLLQYFAFVQEHICRFLSQLCIFSVNCGIYSLMLYCHICQN
ncbi:GLI pathogenesis-related 2, like isoform X2 [Heterodontus francisci]|uniref:GLI pathogenesis-related 2, like isoform X2 n=1 Tax=Heterodontus francisci TaxID=7792 RepID=UPI00355C4A4C